MYRKWMTSLMPRQKVGEGVWEGIIEKMGEK